MFSSGHQPTEKGLAGPGGSDSTHACSLCEPVQAVRFFKHKYFTDEKPHAMADQG